MEKYLLGVDIGTYESKGVLLDSHYNIYASYSVKHTMDNPKPNHFEHDANAIWWHDFCAISQNLVSKSNITADQIVCAGVSTLGTDCLPVDEYCNPLRPAILYGIDSRATDEIAYLTKHYGDNKVIELFGHPLCSGDTATKILWIKNKEPEIYSKTYKFLTGSSFMVAKLTGEYVIDRFLALKSFNPLYHIDGSINESECTLFCRPDQIASCKDSTAIAGYVTHQAAFETGLAEGTPVITGTGDSAAEAVSVGLVEPGTVFFQFGSSMFYYFGIDHPVAASTSRVGNGSIKGSSGFTVPGMYSIGDGTNAAGTLTRWIRDLLYAEELRLEKEGGINAFAIMAREAATVPAGSDGMMILPYLYGERSPIQDPHAQGLIFGLNGNHNRKHFNRAALEAVGYSVLQHIRLFNEMGLKPSSVITAGGGTQNRTWMQIICDMIGMDIVIPETWQTSCFGDAMMAAIGIGLLRDFKDLKQALPAGTVLKSNLDNHALYESRYKQYIQLYLNNKEIMHQNR